MTPGIDISNYQGEVTQSLTDCWKASGIGHVFVRGSLETADKTALAQRQMAAIQAAGIPFSVYVWMYSSWGPMETIDAALAAFDSYGAIAYAIDCEEQADIGNVAQNTEWIRSAVAELQAENKLAVIYTGAWWWNDNRYMGGSTAFASLPLWNADYDGVPDLSEWTPYGGWTGLIGKQYSDSTTVCGEVVDLDVFDEAQLVPPPQPPPQNPQPDVQQQLDALAARVTALEGSLARLNEALVARFEAMRVALDPASVPGE